MDIETKKTLYFVSFHVQKMKNTLLFSYIMVCAAIEIQHGIDTNELLFTDYGTVLQTENWLNLKLRVNVHRVFERNDLMNQHLRKISTLCSVNNTICEPLRKFMSIKNSQIRNKRFLDIDVMRMQFESNIFDQFRINEIKNDVEDNRRFLFNQTQIMNQTWNLQKGINNETFNELMNVYDSIDALNNQTIHIRNNIRLDEIIQSIILDLLRGSEVHDAIDNVLKEPLPWDILKIVNSNVLYDVFKKLNSSIRHDELMADSRDLNVRTILSLSKIKTEMRGKILTFYMEIPLTTSSWQILKVHPIIFKRGSELLEVSNVSDYLLIHGNEHVLLSTRELIQCHSWTKNKFCCLLNTTNSHVGTCESDVRNGHGLGKCKMGPSALRYRIIQTNENTIFFNNFDNQRVVWGCSGFERMFETNESIGICSSPGCHVRIRDTLFMVPEEVERIDVESPFTIEIGNENNFEYNLQFHIRNGSTIEKKFSDQIVNIEDKLETLANNTSKKIKSGLSILSMIEAFSFDESPFEILSFSLVVVVIIVVVICIRK